MYIEISKNEYDALAGMLGNWVLPDGRNEKIVAGMSDLAPVLARRIANEYIGEARLMN